jgi:G:T-mismatch repair DNA endonuclease (very short patch repair protein)
MKERIKKEFICGNCENNYLSNSMNSKFCCDDCRKEFKVKDGKVYLEDYVICEICKRATGNVTGSHLKNHPEWTSDMYKSRFPNSQVIANNVMNGIRSGSINAGNLMKLDHNRERMRSLFIGEKNPMHKKNTTEKKRKESSPFSPHFYLKKDPSLSMEDAKKIADDKLKNIKIISWNKLEYWQNLGYTLEESKKIISSKQSTFSLEKCVEKFGKEKGTKTWEERQEKWKKKVFNENTHISRGYSKIGESFVDEILNLMRVIGIPTDNILHGKNEKFIKTKEGRVFKYDLTITDSKKIIEFNGDFWHCNPEIFESDFYNKPKKMSAIDIWKYDNDKIKAATDNGYRILTIWENEFRNNKPSCMSKCLDFIVS